MKPTVPTVSFDFDDTLSHTHVQAYAKELIDRGIDVWVVTTRYDENGLHNYGRPVTHDDLYDVIERVGIPRHKVRFTMFEYKAAYLEKTQILFHVDDNIQEYIQMTNRGCKTKFVDVISPYWKETCEKLLQEFFDISTTKEKP